jgi:predicted nucleic acid-binding protein
MIVVADTSPLNYLVLIDEVELLPWLFERVMLPKAVFNELKHPRSPAKVRTWAEPLPEWAVVRQPHAAALTGIDELDSGEREAIQLAVELGIETILLDDQDARRYAEALHLQVRGTLGILERGVRLGRTDPKSVLARLEQTNFRMSPQVRQAFLDRCRPKR